MGPNAIGIARDCRTQYKRNQKSVHKKAFCYVATKEIIHSKEKHRSSGQMKCRVLKINNNTFHKLGRRGTICFTCCLIVRVIKKY